MGSDVLRGPSGIGASECGAGADGAAGECARRRWVMGEVARAVRELISKAHENDRRIVRIEMNGETLRAFCDELGIDSADHFYYCDCCIRQNDRCAVGTINRVDEGRCENIKVALSVCSSQAP